MKQTEKREILTRNTVEIAAMQKDMETYCGCLNRAVEAFRAKSIYDGDISEQIARELCVLKADAITNEIKTAYAKDIQATILPFKKRRIREQMKDALGEVGTVLNGLQIDIERNKIGLRKNISSYDRMPYIVVSEGKISYDKERIIEENTVYSDADRKEFIERARRLYDALVSFDKECRALSGGNLFGLSDLSSDAVITIDELHTIHLDLRHIDWLDFADREELMKKADNIKNSKVWE